MRCYALADPQNEPNEARTSHAWVSAASMCQPADQHRRLAAVTVGSVSSPCEVQSSCTAHRRPSPAVFGPASHPPMGLGATTVPVRDISPRRFGAPARLIRDTHGIAWMWRNDHGCPLPGPVAVWLGWFALGLRSGWVAGPARSVCLPVVVAVGRRDRFSEDLIQPFAYPAEAARRGAALPGRPRAGNHMIPEKVTPPSRSLSGWGAAGPV